MLATVLSMQREGLRGNAVRVPPEAAAVPATVSGEPRASGHWVDPGKARRGGDPQARRPAVEEPSERLAGVPGKERQEWHSRPGLTTTKPLAQPATGARILPLELSKDPT